MLEYNYLVKKVVFKISILPIIKIIAATFIHAFFACVLLVIAAIYFFPILFDFFALGYVLKVPTLIVISTVVIIASLTFLTGVVLHVLKKQVEDITNGSIAKRNILITLACGVGIAIALSMTRVLFDISIWWFIVPGYVLSIVLIFFVPEFFTSIAFDSGGVASGPLTSTFILPLSIGVCSILYKGTPSLAINSFGVVAFVAMAPLITIQLLGLNYKIKTMKLEKAMKKLVTHDDSDDVIITFKKTTTKRK